MERRLGETGFSFSANKSVYLAVMQMWKLGQMERCLGETGFSFLQLWLFVSNR